MFKPKTHKKKKKHTQHSCGEEIVSKKTWTTLRIFVFLQVLSLNKAEDAHNGYQSLLSEINDPDTKYILRTANRLYGEKTFEFLSVSKH